MADPSEGGKAKAPVAKSEGGESAVKRSMFRFRPRYDIALLREVIKRFPWGAGYGHTRAAWTAVAADVQTELAAQGVAFEQGSSLDHTLAKRRADVLLETFRQGDMESLRGAGSASEVEKRDKLAAILARLMNEYTEIKAKGSERGPNGSREERIVTAMTVARRNVSNVDESIPDEMTSSPTENPPQGQGRVAPKRRASAVVATGDSGATKRARRTVLATARPQDTSTPDAPTKLESEYRQREQEYRDCKLRLEERRLELEERRLEWQTKEAEEQARERQVLLEFLRSQSALMQELLAQLGGKPGLDATPTAASTETPES